MLAGVWFFTFNGSEKFNAQAAPGDCHDGFCEPPSTLNTATKPILYISKNWDNPDIKQQSGCSQCNALSQTDGAFDQTKADWVKSTFQIQDPKTNPNVKEFPSIGEKDAKGKESLTQGQKATDKVNAAYDKSKEKIDKGVNCGLVTPGQSKVNGDMWGQKNVAQPKEVDPRPLLNEPGCEITTPSSCAQDIDGMISAGVSTIATSRVSTLNWWYFKENPNKKPLGVTSDADFALLTETGKKPYPVGVTPELVKDSKAEPASNQTILTKKMKEAKIYVPESQYEHGQYAVNYPETMTKNPQSRNGYTPDGSEMRMTPGVHTSRLDYSADKPSATPTDKSNPDTKVTDECIFKKATKDDLKNLGSNPGGWPNLQGGNQGGGGGGGGGQGGGLDKILPELMKALQGLGKGNQNQQASPSPSPSAFACPPDTQAVCGTDAITYANRCVAEYKNQIAVKHIGECTEADQNTATLDGNSKVATTLLQQLSTSGLPTQLITDIAQVVAKLIGSFLSGTSVLTETVVK